MLFSEKCADPDESRIMLAAIRRAFTVCRSVSFKPQLHCHDFGHDGATTHPDLSSRGASA